MKHFVLASLLATLAVPALAADVGVSIHVGDPNFYGQINIGNYPRPQLVNVTPVVVQRTTVVYEPVYLRVPPGHAKHWSDHCAEYQACGRPVYFVQDNWYSNVYAPAYREHEGHGNGKHENEGHGNGKHEDEGNGGGGKSKGKGKKHGKD